ncbi:MAG: hypothetical protein ACF8CQ_00890 [Rhodopirellula sp. JB044]|uniref:hypothetical protein n=1 Tax=Rhodopirellula sp. JB044 TaxID=3342844 RepID=UPI00370B674E
MKYRHLYRSSILVMLAAAAVCAVGLRSVTSHSHSGGNEGHTHAAVPHGLTAHVHPAEPPHSHGHSHPHAHAHSHDHGHEHSHPHPHATGSSHTTRVDDQPTHAKTSGPSATLTAASHHSHYVFFGFEFTIFESAAQTVAAYGATDCESTPRVSSSHDSFRDVDVRSWLARIFDVRSPLPPESPASVATPSTSRFYRTLCLNAGRLDDPPSSPPPELASH